MLEHAYAQPKKPARVVVIGSNGFVGGAIVRRLAEDGVAHLALGRAELDLLAAGAGAKLAGLLRPGDAAVAAAAIAPCETAAMLLDNMRIVQTLVEGLSTVQVAHVVNISSDAIYADGPVPLTEETPAAPTSLHGAMHLAREIALRTELRAPIAMLRPTLIYGAADPHNGYGPNRFRRLAAADQEIVLFGEGEERRDHVAVGDVAQIALRVLKHRSHGALNIASGEVHSFRDVADMTVALAGTKAAIKSSPRTGPMPHNGYRPFDVSATKAAFPDFHYIRLGLISTDQVLGHRLGEVHGREPDEGADLECEDEGYDIGTYIAAAKAVSNRQLIFFNTFSEILADDWLSYFEKALNQPGIGVVGATGSWQALSSGLEADP
jgi:UDP-glucose 4-epimerase